MKKREIITKYTKYTISISHEINKKMDKGNYNKSKLIDSLLINYFKNKK